MMINNGSPHAIRCMGIPSLLFVSFCFCAVLNAAVASPSKTGIDLNDAASGRLLADAMKAGRFEYYESVLRFYSLHSQSENDVKRFAAYDALAEAGAALLTLSRSLYANATTDADDARRAETTQKASQFESDGLIFLRGLAERSTGRRASRYWLMLGNHFIQTGDFGTADLMLRDSIKSDYTHTDAYAMRGDLRYRIKRYDESADDYETAIRLSPDSTPLYAAAARSRQAAGKYAASLEHYANALQRDPNSFDMLAGRLLCANAAGNPQSDEWRIALLERFITPAPGQDADAFAAWQSQNAWVQIDQFERAGHTITAFENLGATALVLYRTEAVEPLFHYIFLVNASETAPQRLFALESTGAEAESGPADRPVRR